MRELVVEIPGIVPETVSVALKEDLTISEDIEREAKYAAYRFGYYAVLAEKAASKQRKLNISFELWQAEECARQRAELEATGAKRIAQAQLDRLLQLHPKYRAYTVKIEEAKYHEGVLRSIAKAFEIKKDLVQTISANRRREIT